MRGRGAHVAAVVAASSTLNPVDPPATTFRQSIRLLTSRRFGIFWLASLMSNIGTWAQQTAQPWLLLSLGASPMVLGLDAFALGAPVLALTLLGGVLADRADRRTVIASCQLLQMLCPVALVALLLSGTVRPWMVIALSLVVGVTDALSMPSFQTIVGSIVERRQLPAGIALNATQFNLSRILGPSLAGVLMASVGAVGAFTVSAVSYLPFILVAWWILPRGQPTPAPGGAADPVAAEAVPGAVFAGARAVLAVPALRTALLTMLVNSTLCSALLTFCPVLIKSVFQTDVNHFSLTMSAFGAGGLLGALGLLAVNQQRDPQTLVARLALAYAVVVVLAALNPWAWLLPPLFLLGGLLMTASNATANTALQSSAPPAIRGQSISLFMLAMRGGVAVGGLVTGASVAWLGVREALLLNGLLAIAAQLAVHRGRWRVAAPA